PLRKCGHTHRHRLAPRGHKRTRKDGAKGVDGQSAADYAADLEGNLAALLERAKSGTYRAPPVRRVHILKGDGKQTPARNDPGVLAESDPPGPWGGSPPGLDRSRSRGGGCSPGTIPG